MAVPKRRTLTKLITLTILILISIFTWNYLKNQDVNRYVSRGGFPASYPMTLLMRASFEGDLAQVQSLLDRGADITLTNAVGKNALYFAIRGGNHDIVRLLLDNGIGLNDYYPNDYKTSPDCTLLHAIPRSQSSPEDYEIFSELANHTQHDTSSHNCNIPIVAATQSKPEYLDLFLSSLDPETASWQARNFRLRYPLGRFSIKKLNELDPDMNQQINDILAKYE